jgi:predicted nucleic acid-binding Zn ribbon protein
VKDNPYRFIISRPPPTNKCAICHAPLTQPKTGRPRQTCSDRCRQRLHRRRHRRTFDQIELARELRIIRRTQRRLERRHGPLPPDDPTLYARIGLHLSRGLPIRICPACGLPFPLYAAPGPSPTYCSERCASLVRTRTYNKRQRGHITTPRPPEDYEQARINLHLSRGWPVPTCPECGRYFISDNPGRPAKYCSKRCRQRAWRYRRLPLYRTCHQCGKRYRVSPKRRGVQKYCSSRCRYRATYLRKRRRNAATK